MNIRGILVPAERKALKGETLPVELPQKVVIPMLHGKGEPCEVLVRVGDKVKVGTLIGDGEDRVCVHSSVSGEVEEIRDFTTAEGVSCQAVVIHTDGEQTVDSAVKPPVITSKEEFIEALRRSGCVGLGGSGDPTFKKLSAQADKLIINAVECEPFLVTDYRCIMENGKEAVEGIRQIMKYLAIDKAVIAVSNDTDAAEKLQELTAGDESISVKQLPPRYPLGQDRILAKRIFKVNVKSGESPEDKGIIVLNISTAEFIGEYLKTGMPLVTRRVTVDGSIVKTPCCVRAAVGTSVAKLLEFAQANLEVTEKIVLGGPMTGICLDSDAYPICKHTGALTAFIKPLEDKPKGLIAPPKETNCFRCGRCMRACPEELMPMKLEKAFDKKNKAALKRLGAEKCSGCGACSYVCPAKREPAQKIAQAKELLAQKDEEVR